MTHEEKIQKIEADFAAKDVENAVISIEIAFVLGLIQSVAFFLILS